ncbi:MAG: N-acetyltransferase [Gammaproteobacteria bacterium]|jgi:putative acetyltransferase|nr:N-acetyltransferase [Gammaproteobacteria bacterium]MBT3724736.1 N-acetyltransferase [Gammaproteobacteria bacterium]MBT4076178.1 N-acetyltransferase [Gammaproteobacteria bacterium]MBT4195516.1 N-acetyltransferase [Gammaproteobacteria bacterium]MBT4448762.1 N-acetyltransferase [Gammaproteobacteria bacterium]
MNLLPYSPNNIEEIKQLFTKVFTDSEGQSEGLVIGNLVYDLMTGTDVQDFYGFVAVEKESIIGSIFFTRLTFDSEVNASLLSPVAIQTNYQGKGIGQKLINHGIHHLKENGVGLVFTYGDPKFYSKVGFKLITEKTVKAPFTLTYPEGWLGQSLVGDEIKPVTGDSYCVEAFNNTEYW